jgi:hypothetical protein
MFWEILTYKYVPNRSGKLRSSSFQKDAALFTRRMVILGVNFGGRLSVELSVRVNGSLPGARERFANQSSAEEVQYFLITQSFSPCDVSILDWFFF